MELEHPVQPIDAVKEICDLFARIDSGGLAFVPVRHLAQGPSRPGVSFGASFAPLVSFGAPSLLRYMYI